MPAGNRALTSPPHRLEGRRAPPQATLPGWKSSAGAGKRHFWHLTGKGRLPGQRGMHALGGWKASAHGRLWAHCRVAGRRTIKRTGVAASWAAKMRSAHSEKSRAFAARPPGYGVMATLPAYLGTVKHRPASAGQLPSFPRRERKPSIYGGIRRPATRRHKGKAAGGGGEIIRRRRRAEAHSRHSARRLGPGAAASVAAKSTTKGMKRHENMQKKHKVTNLKTGYSSMRGALHFEKKKALSRSGEARVHNEEMW